MMTSSNVNRMSISRTTAQNICLLGSNFFELFLKAGRPRKKRYSHTNCEKEEMEIIKVTNNYCVSYHAVKRAKSIIVLVLVIT